MMLTRFTAEYPELMALIAAHVSARTRARLLMTCTSLARACACTSLTHRARMESTLRAICAQRYMILPCRTHVLHGARCNMCDGDAMRISIRGYTIYHECRGGTSDLAVIRLSSRRTRDVISIKLLRRPYYYEYGLRYMVKESRQHYNMPVPVFAKFTDMLTHVFVRVTRQLRIADLASLALTCKTLHAHTHVALKKF